MYSSYSYVESNEVERKDLQDVGTTGGLEYREVAGHRFPVINGPRRVNRRRDSSFRNHHKFGRTREKERKKERKRERSQRISRVIQKLCISLNKNNNVTRL